MIQYKHRQRLLHVQHSLAGRLSERKVSQHSNKMKDITPTSYQSLKACVCSLLTPFTSSFFGRLSSFMLALGGPPRIGMPRKYPLPRDGRPRYPPRETVAEES